MEHAVAIFFVINLAVIGVSHILAPKVWVDFFIALREQGDRGVFAVGFMALFFGSILVAFHPIYSGWSLIVTLFGWAQVIKATLYFAWPKIGMRGLARVNADSPRDFIIAGAGLLLLAGLVGVDLIWGG